MDSEPIKPITLKTDLPYFRGTWNRVVMLLLAVSFTPLILVGGLMYMYAATALKDKNIESLEAMVMSHQRMVDQYILERAADLNLAAAALTTSDTALENHLDQRLATLHQGLPSFVDLGLIGPDGRHLAYTGPYDLKGNNYKDSSWFEPALARDLYISDMFLGFRNVPHLIMTVRIQWQGQTGLMRGTLKAAPFEALVHALPVESAVDAYLVNQTGQFQTGPTPGRIMTQSAFSRISPRPGIQLISKNNQILATTWLKQAPWMLVAHIDKKSFSAPLNRVRNVGLFVFALGSLLILPTVLITTNYLVANLEYKRRDLNMLNEHLMRHAYTGSALKYAVRIMENLKSGLINAQTSLPMRSAQQHPVDLKPVMDHLEEGLTVIDRLEQAISPLDSHFIIRDIDLDQMLDDTLDLLIDGMFGQAVRVERRPGEPGLVIRTEQARTRRMFRDLIMVSLELMNYQGHLVIETGTTDQKSVYVKIKPEGPGATAKSNNGHWALASTVLQDIYASGAEEKDRLWTQNLTLESSDAGPCFLVSFRPPAEDRGSRNTSPKGPSRA